MPSRAESAAAAAPPLRQLRRLELDSPTRAGAAQPGSGPPASAAPRATVSHLATAPASCLWLVSNCTTTISLWTLLPLTDMGDMGDPPKSKRLFYLAGLGVLFLCGGLSRARGPGARPSWSPCLQRGGGGEVAGSGLPPRLHARCRLRSSGNCSCLAFEFACAPCRTRALLAVLGGGFLLGAPELSEEVILLQKVPPVHTVPGDVN